MRLMAPYKHEFPRATGMVPALKHSQEFSKTCISRAQAEMQDEIRKVQEQIDSARLRIAFLKNKMINPQSWRLTASRPS